MLIHHHIRSFNSNYLEFSAIMNNFFAALYAFSETWFSDRTYLPIDSFTDFHTMHTDWRGRGIKVRSEFWGKDISAPPFRRRRFGVGQLGAVPFQRRFLFYFIFRIMKKIQ